MAYPSGIVGLRLFPNPAFDEAAAKHWDAKRYFSDPAYYNDKDLVRPYRVGMSCGFCHVGPSPITSAGRSGASGMVESEFDGRGAVSSGSTGCSVMPANPDNFMFQLVHTYRPGAMDTSLVSTDNINNPRTMNAVYSLGAAARPGIALGQRTLTGGQLNNQQFNDFVSDGPLTRFFTKPNMVSTVRVLKDGSDSVGALGRPQPGVSEYRPVQ